MIALNTVYIAFLNLLLQFISDNYNLQNEYLASCDLRREFISGFSCSAGINMRNNQKMNTS